MLRIALSFKLNLEKSTKIYWGGKTFFFFFIIKIEERKKPLPIVVC